MPCGDLLHAAMHSSIQSNFGVGVTTAAARVIHCMCHDPRILLKINTLYSEKPIVRASDDYYPEDDNSHANHIVDCAFNSLLISQVGVPDWDMFTTDSKFSKLHAMSRSVSGGPVYFSDKVSADVDAAILRRAISGGSCEGPLLPSRSSLFTARDRSLLRLQNVNRLNGVIFACNIYGYGWDDDKLKYIQTDAGAHRTSITSSVLPSMVDAFREIETPFVVWMGEGGGKDFVLLKGKDDEIEVTLGHLQGQILTVCPTFDGGRFAAIGFVDFFNVGGRVLSVKKLENLYRVGVKRGRDGGIFAVAVRNRDVKAVTDSEGRQLDFEAQEGNECAEEAAGMVLYKISVVEGPERLEEGEDFHVDIHV